MSKSSPAWTGSGIDESKLRPLPNIGDIDYQVAKWKKTAIYEFNKRGGTLQKTAKYYNRAVGMSFKQMRQSFMSELSQD